MEDLFVKNLWDEADELLMQADNELNRPEEDVVSPLVCNISRLAIRKYLTGYLLKNGIEPDIPTTMGSLLEQCRSHNKSFENIDFSPINCHEEEHDTDYCLNVEDVGGCYKVAQFTEDIVKN
ncbi:MAG: hypothetical protein HKN67_11505 [Saprospiraceae bacterium]|nr:hypothetical protein [Bacteroidia bacterium]MBT8228834.1 hypothetical protein [Bacteroidia bacterium]NNF22558.1 hypothetical protein [Saprospiraceae bacterium]